jgi:ketosteroid isomerase-like protein
MSKESVELVRSMYTRLNETGDAEEGFRDLAPDVEFEISWRTGRDSPDFRVLHGIDEVRQAIREQSGPFEQFLWEIHELHDAGDRVVAILELHATPEGSSASVSTGRFGYVFTVRDGRIVRVQDFPDPAEALKAAGLA